MHHNLDTNKHDVLSVSGIKPVPIPLYPTMHSPQSVVDLAYSQLPDVPPNTVLRLLMIYHNTLLATIKSTQE